VLALNTLISPRHPMPPDSAGLVYGQDVFFLGFPYGWSAEVKDLNRGFPLPFVKKAIVSNIRPEIVCQGFRQISPTGRPPVAHRVIHRSCVSG
jgi:hypothetical protein